MTPQRPTCPICKRVARPRTENPAFPFCSIRCRQVDLGRWLDESYRIPTTEAEEEDSPTAGASDEPRNGAPARRPAEES